MKVRTPRFALRKSSLRKILILVMALIGFAVIFGFAGLVGSQPAPAGNAIAKSGG